MTDPQAQSERAVNAHNACLASADAPITLTCPKCGKTKQVERVGFDPPTAVTALTHCEDCSVGDKDSVTTYLDASGEEITDALTVAPDISADGVKWTCFLCHAENISGHLCKECHRPGRAIAGD